MSHEATRKQEHGITPKELSELLAPNLRQSAETTITNIECVAEACSQKRLSLSDVCIFRQRTKQIVPVLLQQLRAGSPVLIVPADLYSDEIGRLRDASLALDEAYAKREVDDREDKPAPWCLHGPAPNGLIEWWSNLDGARYECENACRFWRQYWNQNSNDERQRALTCIAEIEKRIPSLRSHLLSKWKAQCNTIAKCMLLIAQLPVYASDLESLRVFSDAVLGSPIDDSDAWCKVSAFSRAILGPVCGEEDWLQKFDSLLSVWKSASHLESLYDDDGRLDSNERVIHERAYLDPLDREGELGTIDKASLEAAVHPDVHLEVEDLGAALKQAGVKPRQRDALLMRRNGEIMSRTDANEWKRTQRAIAGKRSKLVAAIEAATKKRVIKSPLISAANYSGVYREGPSYTLPIPGEDRPLSKTPPPDANAAPWFRSTPPPISRTNRKTKNLFKKVST